MAIVCEGQKTETDYFIGIRREYRLATARMEIVGLGADPLTVVKKAEEYIGEYDHVWAVFDVEASGPHGRHHASLAAAMSRADSKGVRCAMSHPCFELWLILHFRYHAGYLNNRQAQAMAGQLDFGYQDKGFDFARVWPHHRQAFENADMLDREQTQNHENVTDRNPWTSVQELVRQLVALTGGSGSGPEGATPGAVSAGRPPRRAAPPGPRRR